MEGARFIVMFFALVVKSSYIHTAFSCPDSLLVLFSTPHTPINMLCPILFYKNAVILLYLVNNVIVGTSEDP